MKTFYSGNKIVLIVTIFLIFLSNNRLSLAEIKIKERNILASEAKTIDFNKSLITDNSWIKLPDYKNRQFWQNLPSNLIQEYVKRAENYLGYDWPVVKATDYLEFIRSGDRRQGAYAACSNALISLVMGELVEGKGRFTRAGDSGDDRDPTVRDVCVHRAEVVFRGAADDDIVAHEWSG